MVIRRIVYASQGRTEVNMMYVNNQIYKLIGITSSTEKKCEKKPHPLFLILYAAASISVVTVFNDLIFKESKVYYS